MMTIQTGASGRPTPSAPVSFLPRGRIFPLRTTCRDEGFETLTNIARSYNVGHSTISRLR
jgi:hypothetical protein